MKTPKESITFSDAARAITPGWYRHYKGLRHEVVGLGHHSETLEELVIYRHEGQEDFWARPVSMWFEDVTYNGVTQPRFVREEV